MKKTAVLVSVLVLLLSSCVVTEDITASTGFSGTSTTDVSVDPFFLSVLEDLSTLSESESGSEIMDNAIGGFASAVNDSSSSTDVTLTTDGDGKRYILTFDYISLAKLMKDLNNGDNNSILKITSTSLSFNLNMGNYSEIKEVIPFLSDSNFEVYGPEYSNGMTEEEYIEMITFLLGEESRDALEKSTVTIKITTPGTITKVEGAEKTGEKSASYTFPVISFLLLNEALSFSVNWK